MPDTEELHQMVLPPEFLPSLGLWWELLHLREPHCPACGQKNVVKAFSFHLAGSRLQNQILDRELDKLSTRYDGMQAIAVELTNLNIRLEEQLALWKKEAKHWKSNHDEQVRKKRRSREILQGIIDELKRDQWQESRRANE